MMDGFHTDAEARRSNFLVIIDGLQADTLEIFYQFVCGRMRQNLPTGGTFEPGSLHVTYSNHHQVLFFLFGVG